MTEENTPLPSNPVQEDTIYMPDMAQVQGVMPENLAALRQSRGRTNIVNVSTTKVEKNVDFDTGNYEAQCAALAGQAEHLKLLHRIQGAAEPLMQLTRQFETEAAPLASLHLPDTHVNIGGQKLEASSDIKQYANDIDQGIYTDFVHKMVGTACMDELLKHCTKANMMSTPALWLNQQLDLESQKTYVHTIARHSPQAIQQFNERLDADARHKTDEMLKAVLGNLLFGKIQNLAYAQQTAPYAIFVLLTHRVLGDLIKANRPVTAVSIWDNVTSKKAEPFRPTVTAQYVTEELRR
jgi:hypothetical protein